MTAQIIPFPQDHNYGAARAVARDVLTMQMQVARQNRFDRALRALGNQLSRSGLSADQIDVELESFTGLVNDELLHLAAKRTRTGGAA